MYTKHYTFSIGSDEIVIKNFIKRYHFDETNMELIRSTGIFLAGVITINAAICYEQERVVCGVTLGKHYDELESLVEESGNLLLCYCMECFGMEFLSRAYKKMNEVVFEEKGKWMGNYHFLDWESEEDSGKQKNDNTFPHFLENGGVPETVAKVLKASNISWQKGMLYPLKSVIFTAEYKTDKAESGCHDCSQCGNTTCSFRERIKPGEKVRNSVAVLPDKVYSYGISRILENSGKREV